MRRSGCGAWSARAAEGRPSFCVRVEQCRRGMPRRPSKTTCRDWNGDETDIGCALCSVTPAKLLPNTRTSLKALAVDLREPRPDEGLVRRCRRAVGKNDRGAYLMLALALAIALFATLRAVVRAVVLARETLEVLGDASARAVVVRVSQNFVPRVKPLVCGHQVLLGLASRRLPVRHEQYDFLTICRLSE